MKKDNKEKTENQKDDIYNLKNGFIPIDQYFAEMEEKERQRKDLEGSIRPIAPETSNLPHDQNSIDSLVDQKKGGNETKAKRSVLNEILTEKISFLREILGDIDTQIKDREKLKTSLIAKFDEGICYLQSKLYELDAWEHGRSRSVDTRRLQLEKELEALKSQQSDEIRESWRDIALLRKEHRKFFHEYRNALRRVKIVLPNKAPSDKETFVNDDSIESRWEEE